MAATSFNTFTTAGNRGKPPKKKQTEKAVRMSQNELLDALNACFRDYRYNSLKALKQRLRQPEVFIKSSLESIATLVRSGPFNGNYRLNPEHEQLLNIGHETKDQAADEASLDEYDEEDDDDDEADFEDVKMTED